VLFFYFDPDTTRDYLFIYYTQLNEIIQLHNYGKKIEDTLYIYSWDYLQKHQNLDNR
jgi:hypothetical protein